MEGLATWHGSAGREPTRGLRVHYCYSNALQNGGEYAEDRILLSIIYEPRPHRHTVYTNSYCCLKSRYSLSNWGHTLLHLTYKQLSPTTLSPFILSFSICTGKFFCTAIQHLFWKQAHRLPSQEMFVATWNYIQQTSGLCVIIFRPFPCNHHTTHPSRLSHQVSK